MKAVVMCGGIGSRLKPVTEIIPKPMVRILNRPVIDVIIEKLINTGVNEIYISLGYMATEIIEYCERKKYNAEIKFCSESKPLGTAGGVKNCISETEDDIIVLSGDNVFDFDIKNIISYHYSSDSDITLCAVDADDPREYGVIITDDDGSIRSFLEKPTWEQAESTLVNTGIYILKGSILEMIPKDTYYDFSENLFPKIFQENKRFMCYEATGYWGDMGQFEAYRKISRDILEERYMAADFNIKKDDLLINDSTLISAPFSVGANLIIGKKSVVKDCSVIGNSCTIGDSCVLSGVIIGDNCNIGNNCELNNCIICDNSIIGDNCSIEENAVIGYGAKIGRFSRILKDNRIWPGRRVHPESVISTDLFYETPNLIEFDIFGISGNINSQITVGDACKLGQSIASIKNISKIGFGCDDSMSGDIYKSVCMSGARTCGAVCYDFGPMFKSQGYFYSAYCTLDAFIFISIDGDIINFSFYGKNGMPVDAKTARNINNNYKFSAYSFCAPENCREVYNMTLFSTVYKSYFKKISDCDTSGIFFGVECENPLLKNLLNEILLDEKHIQGKLQLLMNNNGSEFYIIEDKKIYSSDRIFALLCEIELADSKTVLIPEDAPAVIEDSAAKYNGNIIKAYECNNGNETFDNDTVLSNIWCFDPVLLLAKLLNVIVNSKLSLAALFEYQKDFTVRRNIIEFDAEPAEIRKIIENSGAKRNSNDPYYSIDSRNGCVRLRQMGNANRIRMLVEAADMESAREISTFVIKKIKSTNIDNIKQK